MGHHPQVQGRRALVRVSSCVSVSPPRCVLQRVPNRAERCPWIRKQDPGRRTALVSEGNEALTDTEVQRFAEGVHGKARREVSLVHMGAGESGVFSA